MKTAKFGMAVILSMVLLGFYGCKDDDPVKVPDDDYIVIGSYYGECGGEKCVEIFKLENGSLYEDTLDQYPSFSTMPYKGVFIKTDNKYISDVRELLDSVPDELLNSSSAVIGMPDAHDQGGLVLELKVNGVVKYWLIDTVAERSPEYMRGFVGKLYELVYKMLSES